MSVQVEVHSSQQKMQGRGSPHSEADLSNGSEEPDDLELHGSAVAKPGPHDVLLGRGGGTNNHSGNIKFRQLVNEHKIRYLACSKVDKPKVARDVVELWRKMTPPGRFLARKEDTKKGPGSVKGADNLWYEVTDKKAREKASQCLRERTPDVMPYIKQLREQQDAITEKGVSMVQHQLQMQQRHEAQHYQTPMVGVNQVVGINEHGEMVMMQQLPPQQYMEHPSHQQQMNPNMMSSTMRRTSLPEPSPHQLSLMPPSGYVQQRSMSVGLGPVQHGQQGGLQQRSMSLGHGLPAQNGSAIYITSGPTPHTQPANLQSIPSSMQTGMQQVNRYHVAQNGEMAPQTVVSHDYHQQMLIQQSQMPGQQYVMQPVQQQVLPQHMQQQQMQFQQQPMMARVPQPMQQQPIMMHSQQINMQQTHQMGQMVQIPAQQSVQHAVTAHSLFDDNNNEPGPYCVQSDPLFSMRIATPSRKKAPEKPSKPAKQAEKADPVKERRKSAKNAPAKAALKQGDASDKRRAPDRTATEASLMSIGTTRTTNLEAGGEITIEEYRKQLQQYIDSNQVKPNGENGEDDELNYNSDLEDDWEKEREKNMRDDKTRGVGRNVSGMSFISSKTAKSGQSMVSGISSGIFSDMSDVTSTKKGAGGNSSLNNSNRSLCSNLSLMSELTDLSENIDTLTLDD